MANPSSSSITTTTGSTTTNGTALPRWPKSCGCGETWSREHWGELTPVGRYQADEWIELRTCVCGKTLAVPMSDLDAR